MRILVLANIGLGLYKFRRELLEELVKEHEVFFCIPEDEFVEPIKAIGCNYLPCYSLERRSTNPVKDYKLYREYIAVIKKTHPDIVFTYTIKPNVYGGLACQRLHIPYIANITGLGTTIENGGILAKISTTLYHAGLKEAKCVFFQNEENRQLFVGKGITKGRTVLIPGSGVNTGIHSVEPYPSDGEGIHFLFVGRIMKDKGIEELLSAMKTIHEERKDVFLDIVGFCDENYSAALGEAERQGYTVFHGKQSDVHPFYTSCHCTVLPSYHEGMANVLLEASSTGRPVIASRVPGCRETFDEGITGFGCEAKNTGSLVDAIRRFLALAQSEREKMGKAARKKMEQEFDRSIVIRAYMDELRLS